MLQFLVGLALLIIYEAYKTHYFKSSPAKTTEASVTGGWHAVHAPPAAQLSNMGCCAARALTYKTPLDWLFWLAIVK